MGIRVVIAPSFFRHFLRQRGQERDLCPWCCRRTRSTGCWRSPRAGQPITVDLETQTVTTPYQDRFTFNLDPFRRHCLLNGLDEVGLTMARGEAIGGFEKKPAPLPSRG